MTVAHFESFAGGRGWSATFGVPSRQRTAYELNEVLPLLVDAEAATKAGSWVALALGYEAAPALDPALPVNEPSEFPLAWMAVFDERMLSVNGASAEVELSASKWEPGIQRAEYDAAIGTIKDYIEAGDTYQVNFTFPLRGSVTGDAFSSFSRIAASQGGAYSAYLDIGTHKIMSFSPELFFEARGDQLVTRPMKGTMKRGRWTEEDLERIDQLKASEKDRAENVMIVDLLRNDLGKVAEFGSVRVTELFAVERLTRALQMTSTVTATRRAGVTLVDVIRALFPCGSVTGAPKRRSMEIIRDLEREPREIYTGAIGILSPNGDAVFNVAIRTLVIDSRTGAATFNVGGGITWDSVTTGEYEEALLKAQFLIHPWPEFDLLETLELADGTYSLLERHLSRARESAGYFGFHWNEAKVATALDDICTSHPVGRWRARLTIDRSGVPSIELVSLQSTAKQLSVKFATSPVDDRDPLLFHKTTARARYNDELERCAPCDDVIFWNARGEVTESAIANVVVSSDGKLWTPPRESGLLAGTFRNELIARGQLFERPITKEELARARSFCLINSVRGWMDALLVPAT